MKSLLYYLKNHKFLVVLILVLFVLIIYFSVLSINYQNELLEKADLEEQIVELNQDKLELWIENQNMRDYIFMLEGIIKDQESIE